jgi:aconitate hydratase
LRANIPAISRHVFAHVDPGYPERQTAAGSGFIVAGRNYGQGSSREHAALAPRHLGLTAVVAESFARIHKANLCNFGLWPLEFADPADRGRLEAGQRLKIAGIGPGLEPGARLAVEIAGGDGAPAGSFEVRLDVSNRQLGMLLAGGLLALEASRRG